jgi:rhodanese-related sulfurtransferase
METIDELLAAARETIDRISAGDLATEQANGAIVVDTRPVDQRERDGALPGALVIDRNVLEWRLVPSSPDRIVDIGEDQRVIIVCNEGYSSSLAAATLRRLGLRGATDLVGGFQAWMALQSPAAGDDA